MAAKADRYFIDRLKDVFGYLQGDDVALYICKVVDLRRRHFLGLLLLVYPIGMNDLLRRRLLLILYAELIQVALPVLTVLGDLLLLLVLAFLGVAGKVADGFAALALAAADLL